MPHSADLARILKLEVPIIVRLAERKLHVEELLRLIPGSIIDLERPAEDELDLLVNNKPVGSGHAVKIGENFGIQVTWVGELAERVHAMAPKEDSAGETVGNDDIASLLLQDVIG